jgi:DNA-binding transcriptional ArsR family regulator
MPAGRIEATLWFVSGKGMKLLSSERFSWPSLGFELRRGENTVAKLEDLPEAVQRRLRGYIESGVVRVLDDGEAGDDSGELVSGVQDIVLGDGEPGRAAVGQTDPEPGERPSPAGGAEGTVDDPIDEDAVSAVTELGRVLSHPIRTEILITFASGRLFDFAELSRRLGKPASTISEHVTALERAGLVRCSGFRKARRYRVIVSELARLKKLIPC